jgi:hypothetical protein
MKIIDKFKKERLISQIFIILTILFMGSCLGCLTFVAVQWIRSDNEYDNEEKAVLNPLSQRLGVEPDWMAVRKYLYCDSLKPGMTVEQVEKVLNRIGPYSLGIGDSKELIFKGQYIDFPLSPEDLHFENERLTTWGPNYLYGGTILDCEGHNP